jgi:hypothetical protein
MIMSDRVQVENKAREGLEENVQFQILHVKKQLMKSKRRL